MRKNESDILQMRLQLSDLKSQLRDKDVLEKRISDMKREQTDSHGTLKVCGILPFIMDWT